MSELTLFIIGAVVFAITVYGTVMGAGVALTRRVAGRGDHADRRLLTTPGYSRPPPWCAVRRNQRVEGPFM